MNSIPEYLYHYTSIETLALILKNKTIRFNSLDRMDDLQEKMTADAKALGKCVYISSWTADNSESIPMWNMYASLKSGVRIKMKTYPFALRECNFEAIRKAFPDVQISVDGMPPPMLIPYHEMMTKGFCAIQNRNEDILFRVKYTDDPSELIPHVVSTTDQGTTISIDKLGKVKNSYWSFQNEWRYIIHFMKMDYRKPPEEQLDAFTSPMRQLINDKYQQPFSYYDMPLSDDSFSSMSITLSPQLSAGNRIIVNSLLEKYNPTAELKDSALLGLL